MSKKIPEKYYKGRHHPIAKTVGDLKKLLAELPNDLPITDGWGSAPELIVYNHGEADMSLEFCLGG